MLEGRGIDFESMGMAQGMAAAVRGARAETDSVIDEANRRIAAGNAEVLKLRAELAKAKAALAVETANSAGFKAQAASYKEALQQVSPGHNLLAATGLVYPNGFRQTRANVIYDAAHDAQAVKLGISDPKKVRGVAK